MRISSYMKFYFVPKKLWVGKYSLVIALVCNTSAHTPQLSLVLTSTCSHYKSIDEYNDKTPNSRIATFCDLTRISILFYQLRQTFGAGTQIGRELGSKLKKKRPKQNDQKAMEEQITEQQVVATYKSLRAEVRQMGEKIAELEMETTEHDRVIQTLNELPNDRKAYRMVGGVLVERTVQEVLPAVKANRDGIAQVLQQLNESIKHKEKTANEWQQKYNIQVQQ